MTKVLVAMSGGVDSTITALKLKEAGYEVQGCYMKLHDDGKSHEENIKKVKHAAEFLGIKYHVLDLSEKFEEFVYNPFVDTYKKGRTPNPCVLCNRNIKFGALIEFAKSLGMEKLATGHYVRIVDGFITEAKDSSKDQSYFLANIKRENIPFMLFPLGELYKEDIKKLASTIPALENFATQKESSEICFVQNTYVEILQKHMSVDKPGDVINEDGEVVGKHQGYMHYTIGKRRGFEVRGAHDPHYVLDINPKNNTITVGKKEALGKALVKADDVNLFIDKNEFEALVKIRYRSPKTRCMVRVKEKKATIELNEKVSGVASGQRAVFYWDNQVIGSGEIV